jgi:hypothetical protein
LENAQPQIVLTEAGMQIDESDEQRENAAHARDASFEPDSNVIADSPGHAMKQEEPIVSTEEGMQIDESEEQPRNASASMHDTWQTGSKTTLETAVHCQKHPPPTFLMAFPIVISARGPKYVRMASPAKSIRKSSHSLKLQLPATERARRAGPTSAQESSCRNPTGKSSDDSRGQSPNASRSMRDRAESDSNSTDDSDRQPKKHCSEMLWREEGM